MRNLVEEDSDRGRGTNSRGSVETSRHSQAIGDVVCEISAISGQNQHVRRRGQRHLHQVQVTAQLDARVDFLLVGLDNGLGILALVLLTRLGLSIRSIRASSLGNGVLVTMAVSSVRVVVASTTSRNPQALIHSNEGHEAHQDGQSQNQVPVGLDKHETRALLVVLAKENLGQQVEQGVAQQAADRKGHHDRQRGRVDVGRAQGEEEVGRARDVERREQSVDGWRSGEQGREELGGEGGGRGCVFGVLRSIEVLHDRACLFGHRYQHPSHDTWSKQLGLPAIPRPAAPG